jgi:two-component system sensor histidine kinase KdpD
MFGMMKINFSAAASLGTRVVAGSVGLVLITVVCFAARLGFAVPCLLYMLLVVMQSLWGGFGSAAIVAVIASACLEYFFIPPVLEWQINDPEYGAALVTYLITSLVITRLASKARSEARVAERKRRDADLLYEAASRLLSLEPQNAAGPDSLRIFREVFSLRAVCFLDADSPAPRIAGVSVCNLAEKTREAFDRGADFHSADHDLVIRCLRSGGRVAGAVGFEGCFGDDGMALTLSVLAATAIERMRSFSSSSKAAADAQAEILRSALLDAFAHEFKTPLAIILAATGGLREADGLRADQNEMTDIIENQTLRLNQLTTGLLRIAKLDRNDVKPHMELTSLHVLVEHIVDQYRSLFGRRITADFGDEPAAVLGDRELLGLAVSQLLDNACKYSVPETAVQIRLDVNGGNAQVHVTNNGAPIRLEDRERIFERFVRGSETEQNVPGAGLGLYVARKILRAHGGMLELDQAPAPGETTFRLSLPLIEYEQHANEACQSAHSGR